METLEQKKRRLFGKQYINTYKKELSNLVSSELSTKNLISIEDTDKLRLPSDIDNLIVEKIDFNIKSELLNRLFSCFVEIKSEKFFLLSSYYKDCGALVIESLNDFNTNFAFDAEHTGLIEIFDSEMKNKILIDYYEEDDMKKVDIEIFGKYWVEKAKSIEDGK